MKNPKKSQIILKYILKHTLVFDIFGVYILLDPPCSFPTFRQERGCGVRAAWPGWHRGHPGCPGGLPPGIVLLLQQAPTSVRDLANKCGFLLIGNIFNKRACNKIHFQVGQSLLQGWGGILQESFGTCWAQNQMNTCVTLTNAGVKFPAFRKFTFHEICVKNQLYCVLNWFKNFCSF